jgi:DNA-binding CsgD family transcriptional regulator
MTARIRSGTPLCAFDADLQVVAWNEAAEGLTGIPACEALGRPCWSVLRATADDGSLVCHKGCSGARLARQDWPVGEQILNISTVRGRRRVAVETLTARAGASFLAVHLFRPAPAAVVRPKRTKAVALTARQLEVLGLLAEGLPVQAIASRLGRHESTVRSHVHGVIVELDAHSQLEAVAKARRRGLV